MLFHSTEHPEAVSIKNNLLSEVDKLSSVGV